MNTAGQELGRHGPCCTTSTSACPARHQRRRRSRRRSSSTSLGSRSSAEEEAEDHAAGRVAVGRQVVHARREEDDDDAVGVEVRLAAEGGGVDRVEMVVEQAADLVEIGLRDTRRRARHHPGRWPRVWPTTLAVAVLCTKLSQVRGGADVEGPLVAHGWRPPTALTGPRPPPRARAPAAAPGVCSRARSIRSWKRCAVVGRAWPRPARGRQRTAAVGSWPSAALHAWYGAEVPVSDSGRRRRDSGHVEVLRPRARRPPGAARRRSRGVQDRELPDGESCRGQPEAQSTTGPAGSEPAVTPAGKASGHEQQASSGAEGGDNGSRGGSEGGGTGGGINRSKIRSHKGF